MNLTSSSFGLRAARSLSNNPGQLKALKGLISSHRQCCSCISGPQRKANWSQDGYCFTAERCSSSSCMYRRSVVAINGRAVRGIWTSTEPLINQVNCVSWTKESSSSNHWIHYDGMSLHCEVGLSLFGCVCCLSSIYCMFSLDTKCKTWSTSSWGCYVGVVIWL